ncbi:hypothetical protein AAFO92_17585 [Roseovarius sp. CAU 1744]|uniref:hypothetical protein n=1 Tax=Roseovarius sp. CAU 1744 TaxID=3140368 RepID=UPI00325BC4E4
MRSAVRYPLLCAVLATCLSLPPVAVRAADFSDPTWPCIQRKVENLSVGLMWPYPVEPVDLPSDIQQSVDTLVSRLVLRRIPVEELAPDVAAFAETHGHQVTLLSHVFSKAFNTLAGTRRKLMTGIGDYSLKQIALAEKIDDTRARMDELMAADSPDFDQVDALEEQLDWDERIYTDRARSLTYVCESPVLIEKRLYAIAQLLQAAMTAE